MDLKIMLSEINQNTKSKNSMISYRSSSRTGETNILDRGQNSGDLGVQVTGRDFEGASWDARRSCILSCVMVP